MPDHQRTYPVNAKISEAAAVRLKQIAKRLDQSYGQILDDLIMGTATAAIAATDDTDDLVSRIEALEFKTSGDDVAELFQRIEELTARVGDLESKLTAQSARDLNSPAEPLTASAVIAELKQAGLKPQAIADELNSRGYRTNRGTEYTRAYISKIVGNA